MGTRGSGDSDNRIEVFNSSVGVRGDWADATGGYVQCRCFNSFAIDKDNLGEYLYVLDATNSRILRYRLND